ncbi:MAG: PepSY-associated TM helix domain-containing protein, partial [Polyangiaceae bacterium]
MRLTRRALLTFWSYHAWAGAALGLVVYVMVLSGTITLFRKSLEVWEEPLRQQSVVLAPSKLQSDLDLALAYIGTAPDELWMTFPEGSHGATSVGFERAEDEPWEQLFVDSRQARAWPVREGLSTFLYHLHFLWHPSAPWLYYLAGIAAVGLLFAIVTGVLLHLRGLVRQFHRFRPNESPRTVWSDLHKVLGVVGLPFQMFYAYSGALLVLGPPLVATLTSPLLGVDSARAKAWTGAEIESSESPGASCEVRPLDELFSVAREAHSGSIFRSATVHHHGRETGWVEFEGAASGPDGSSREITVRVRERDAQVVPAQTSPPSAI